MKRKEDKKQKKLKDCLNQFISFIKSVMKHPKRQNNSCKNNLIHCLHKTTQLTMNSNYSILHSNNFSDRDLSNVLIVVKFTKVLKKKDALRFLE